MRNQEGHRSVSLPVQVELLDTEPPHREILKLQPELAGNESFAALWTPSGVDLVIDGRVRSRLSSTTIATVLRWALEAEATSIDAIRQAELEVIAMARRRCAVHHPPAYLCQALQHLDSLTLTSPASRT